MAYSFLLSLLFAFCLRGMERQETAVFKDNPLSIDTSLIDSTTVTTTPQAPKHARDGHHNHWGVEFDVTVAGVHMALDAHCDDDKDTTSAK